MRGNGLPAHVVRQLTAIDAITVEIAEADRDIAQEAEQDEVCRRLITVPGIGAVTAIRFAAALDGVDRFTDAHKVESYLGLVPGENLSSEHQYRLSITKAGPAGMRWALVQAAWSLRRCKESEAMPLKAWAQQIEQRRGRTSRRWLSRASWQAFSTPSGATGACTTERSARRRSEIRAAGPTQRWLGDWSTIVQRRRPRQFR